MRISPRGFILFAALSALSSSPASAATALTASLWDKPDAMTMSGDPGYAMSDKATAGGVGGMGIDVSLATIPAGEVTFTVTNASTQMVHEMLVVPVTPGEPLPMTADNAVDEDKAGSLGEVAELEPGQTGSLTLTLAAGTYLLLCNVDAHYANGMWTLVTVE